MMATLGELARLCAGSGEFMVFLIALLLKRYLGSINFKRIDPQYPIYSVRVSLGYRAVGRYEGDTIIWFWIGSHADYDRL
jgi:hypothetical protein